MHDLTKLEKRKLVINQLVYAVNDTKAKIMAARNAITVMENKLEARRAELQHQRMLLKFDEIDQLRQQFSDIIAQRDVAVGLAIGDEIPDAVVEKHLGSGVVIERAHRKQKP